MKHLLNGIKGFLIGIANIIPGVSGGTMAILMGIYERLIHIINHLRTELKKNLVFLIELAIGLVLAILLGAKGVNLALKAVPLATICAFGGLIIGGIPLLVKNVKKEHLPSSIISFLLAIVLVIGLTFIPFGEGKEISEINFLLIIILFILGFISAGAMIIPGISGSLILMVLGYYSFVMGIIGDLTNFDYFLYNFAVLGVFGVGCIFGLFAFSKGIELSFKHFKNQTYSAILGFVIASLVGMPIQTFKEHPIQSGNLLWLEITIGILLFFGLGFLAYKFSQINIKPKEEIEKKEETI